MDKLLIFGGGETALLAYEYFTNDSNYEVVAFVMDSDFIRENRINGLPVVPFTEVLSKFPKAEYTAFVAVSSTKLNRERVELFSRVERLGYHFASYISSKAFVWKNAEIGRNVFILEDNTIQPFTKVGDNVVMWSGNHLGHRSVIESHCFVSSHCVISGFCTVGRGSFLGVNCTIEDNVNIEEDSFIGAGALIRKNVGECGLYQAQATERSKLSTHKLFRINK